MVDSVKNAISRIETPKARKADIPSDKGAKGSRSAQPTLRLQQAILFS